jgi:NADPH-dependent 2,4-dienoyl-CoA reductase/sulfur reductase-like enzyme
MTTPRSVLIIGASLAGYSTARALRQLGFAGTITLVGDEPYRPYDRPPLSKEFLAGTMSQTELSLEMPGEDLQADWVLGTRALALDAETRTVTLADASRISADAVVIATGAHARRLPDSLAGLHTVRTLDDATALKADLQPGARLAVVGAGFIGAEIASTARGLGLDVTVVEAAPTPLAGPLGVDLGRAVAGLHERHGVRLHCGVPVLGPTGTDRVTGLELADGTLIDADVVVAGIGAAPAVDWLSGSGLDTSAGVVCSSTGSAGAPGIWAVGDCSAWLDPRRGHPHRVEHWTDARDRPMIVAQDLLGLPTSALRAPYFWSDQYGVKLQFAGWHLGGEEITVEAGSAETGDLLAIYRDDGGAPTAVLGMNQPRLFMRVRKSLSLTLPTTIVERRN